MSETEHRGPIIISWSDYYVIQHPLDMYISQEGDQVRVSWHPLFELIHKDTLTDWLANFNLSTKARANDNPTRN